MNVKIPTFLSKNTKMHGLINLKKASIIKSKSITLQQITKQLKCIAIALKLQVKTLIFR
jgi:hypothetical protein